jgi:hypothetical protein
MHHDEFETAFRETRELIRIELKGCGEQRTVRRVLDDGCPLERAALLIALGHAKHAVVVLKSSPDDEAARAWDQRAVRFLRGLVGDDEPVGVETLRPQRRVLNATPDENLAVLHADEQGGALQQVEDHSKQGWPTCPTT